MKPKVPLMKSEISIYIASLILRFGEHILKQLLFNYINIYLKNRSNHYMYYICIICQIFAKMSLISFTIITHIYTFIIIHSFNVFLRKRNNLHYSFFIFLFLQSFQYLKYNLDDTWYFLYKKIVCLIKFISLKKERSWKSIDKARK